MNEATRQQGRPWGLHAACMAWCNQHSCCYSPASASGRHTSEEDTAWMSDVKRAM